MYRRVHQHVFLSLFLLAAACATSDPPAGLVDGTDTPEPGAQPVEGRQEALLADPFILGDGVTLPALGPIEPGVLIQTQWLGTQTETVDRLSARWTSCHQLTPGLWVLSGEVLDGFEFPLVVETAFVRDSDGKVDLAPVRLTFSGTGNFSLVYDVNEVRPDLDARTVLRSNLGVDSCGLQLSNLQPVGPLTHIPAWSAPADSVQGYPLQIPIAATMSLQAEFATDVWLGNGYGFSTIWLPENPFGFTDLVVGDDPSCPTLSYGVRVPLLRIFEVLVEHRGGPCIKPETVLGDVAGHAGWEWIDSYRTTAQLPLADGWLLVGAKDQATVVATIDDLRPFANLLILPRPGGASTASPNEPRPLGWHRNFGANDKQCESTVIELDQDYHLRLAKGQKCFLEQVTGGVPVVWDYVSVTIEGDPIFSRRIFDGQSVWFLRDDRADSYVGLPSITVLACHDLDSSTWGEEGSACQPSDYPGFTGFAEAD